MRDQNLQVTLMNDRSQGGTAYNSTIEIMQNRRQSQFDVFEGFNELLSEMDSQGHGLKTNVEY